MRNTFARHFFPPENLCQIIEMRSRYCYFGHDHCAYAYFQKEIIIVIPYKKQFLLNNCYQSMQFEQHFIHSIWI